MCVSNPISFYSHSPTSLPGGDITTSSSSSFRSQPTRVLIVTVMVIIVTVVVVLIVLVYRRKHSNSTLLSRPYRAMEQAHDGLSIAVIEDDEFDT